MKDLHGHLLWKYISGFATVYDKELVDVWASANRKNERFLKQLALYWKNHSSYTPDFSKYKTADWERLRQQLNNTKATQVPFYSTSLFRLAAAFITLCTLVSMLLLVHTTLSPDEISFEAHDTILELWLPDSSYVVLNKNSIITLNSAFGQTNRDIELIGEGFFEVKQNENVPFTVQSFEVITTVLGTAFNVESRSADDICVTVVHGKVNVAAGDHSVHLIKFQSANYTKNGGLHNSKLADPNFMAWKTNVFRFSREPLADVIKILAKHYNCKVIVASSVPTTLKITIELNNLQVEEALELIALTLDLNFTKSGDSFLLTTD